MQLPHIKEIWKRIQEDKEKNIQWAEEEIESEDEAEIFGQDDMENISKLFVVDIDQLNVLGVASFISEIAGSCPRINIRPLEKEEFSMNDNPKDKDFKINDESEDEDFQIDYDQDDKDFQIDDDSDDVDYQANDSYEEFQYE
ncbi:MAG: hypothetical protein EZS28_006115 [Streblomastix strix]|uniref:Uncharacterized protein n=1 Tax=Streblomastix strix TaxID=222440 RepID=A0A5J4WTQ2_9EUKA|nr:MAG: hypothetical protein EZS28_006115 [Streblomastix strix]